MSTITNGELETISDIFLEALIEETVPFDAMSTKFEVNELTYGDVVKVPVYPAAAAAAAYNASSNDYETTSGDTVVFKDVTLSSRIKSTLSVTDTQRPKIKLSEMVRTHAQAVVKQAQIVVGNSITAANFSTAGHIGTAANFDTDDIADLHGVAQTANFGVDRFLLLTTPYITNLLKDNDIKNVNLGGSDRVLRMGELGMINSFNVAEMKYLPGNSENLTGFITDKSGLAVASGLIMPQDGSENIVSAMVITDPNSGLSFVQRAHYAPGTGTLFVTWETLFGVAVGQAAGLKRITSS